MLRISDPTSFFNSWNLSGLLPCHITNIYVDLNVLKFECFDFRDSLLVPIINCTTSVYAGFVVFATLGFMAKEKGLPIEDVAEGGTYRESHVHNSKVLDVRLFPLRRQK